MSRALPGSTTSSSSPARSARRARGWPSSSTPAALPEASGVLYDGRSARPRRVAIEVRPAGLDLVDESGVAEDWSYDETTRLEDEGRGELRLARGDARLIVGDPETAAFI